MNILLKNIEYISSLIIKEMNITVLDDEASFESYLLNGHDIVIELIEVDVDKIQKVFNRLPNNVEWSYYLSGKRMWLFGKNLSHIREIQGAIDNCSRMVLFGYGTIGKICITRNKMNLLSSVALSDFLKLWSNNRCYYHRLFYVRYSKVFERFKKYKKRPFGRFNKTL